MYHLRQRIASRRVFSFSEPSLEVSAGGLIPSQAGQGDPVQGGFGLTAAATVKTSTLGLARRRLDQADAAEGRERGLGVKPVGVIAGGDEQCRGRVRADAVAGQQPEGAFR